MFSALLLLSVVIPQVIKLKLTLMTERRSKVSLSSLTFYASCCLHTNGISDAAPDAAYFGFGLVLTVILLLCQAGCSTYLQSLVFILFVVLYLGIAISLTWMPPTCNCTCFCLHLCWSHCFHTQLKCLYTLSGILPECHKTFIYCCWLHYFSRFISAFKASHN